VIELDLAGAKHRIFVFQLELLIEQIDAGNFDTTVAGDAGACALGAWLDGAGTTLAHLPEYAQLRLDHERFHEQVRHMIGLFSAGDVAGARRILDGPFAEASGTVFAAIAALREACREERHGESASVQPPSPAPADPVTLVGVAPIDVQHREISDIVSRLLVRPHGHLDTPLMIDTLRELGALIARHFDAEEAFMTHAGVPAAQREVHRREHAELLEHYRQLALHPENHDAHGPCSVCLAVERWLADHIHAHDLGLKRYAHIPYP
jgi:hemerythrin-like metal-binding protein